MNKTAYEQLNDLYLQKVAAINMSPIARTALAHAAVSGAASGVGAALNSGAPMPDGSKPKFKDRVKRVAGAALTGATVGATTGAMQGTMGKVLGANPSQQASQPSTQPMQPQIK